MFGLTPYERKNGHLVNYDPFKEMEDMERALWGGDWMKSFRTDVRETDDAFILESDLPGFKKEDITVDVNGDYLTVSAERKSNAEEKDDKGNFIRRERSYGKFQRSFDVSDVDVAKIEGEYTDGVLKLTLPKRTAAPESQKRIELK